MRHLHLLLSDLFPPQEIAAELCAGLKLPALEKLLARASCSDAPARGLEDWLCAAYGAEGVAAVRAAADGLEAGEGYWLCADPVSLHLVRAEVLLLPAAGLDARQAAALCDALQAHFAGDGLRFYAPHPQRWYVQVTDAPQVRLQPLGAALGRDVKPLQPQGADALRWQRVVNEAQMLLYAHPLNRERELRGEALVNSLWLWGAGRAARLKVPFDAVGGDDALAGMFAQAAGVAQQDSLQRLLESGEARGLWVCGAARAALQHNDLHGWREAVQQIERDFAQPLLRALQRGTLRRLTLEVVRPGAALRCELTPGAAWKLWRPVRPLASCGV